MEILQDVPIVKATLAYENPENRDKLLIINQALYFTDRLSHILLGPNQL
jgi:hypothetical protein